MKAAQPCMRHGCLDTPCSSPQGTKTLHEQGPACSRLLTARSTSFALGTFLKWDSRIWRRPLTSGLGTTTWRSKRPGRTSALSSDSGKFVAAMQMTPSLGLNLPQVQSS